MDPTVGGNRQRLQSNYFKFVQRTRVRYELRFKGKFNVNDRKIGNHNRELEIIQMK